MFYRLKNSLAFVLVIFVIASIEGSANGCECGLVNTQNRIFLGSDSVPNKYPWIAYIRTLWPGFTGLCTGALIDDRTILTAAHCVHRGNSIAHQSQLLVSFGITSVSDLQYTEVRKVEQFFLHPKLYLDFKEYDIALLRLQNPINFTRDIRPVCLPESHANFNYGKLTVAGYGQVGVNQQAIRLQEADVNFVDRGVCYWKLFNIFSMTDPSRVHVPQSTLCVQGFGGTMICPGDSGGPLMRQNSYGRMVIVGLSQYIFKDCGTYMDVPDLYHDVGLSLDFIKQYSSGACYVQSF